jgi:hypothetical protein
VRRGVDDRLGRHALFDGLVDKGLGDMHGDGQAHLGAGDHGVDPHQLAPAVDQGAARMPGAQVKAHLHQVARIVRNPGMAAYADDHAGGEAVGHAPGEAHGGDLVQLQES